MHNIKISNAGGLPSFDRYFMMVSMSTVFVANTTEKNYPPLSGPIFSDAQRSLLSRGLCHKTKIESDASGASHDISNGG